MLQQLCRVLSTGGTRGKRLNSSLSAPIQSSCGSRVPRHLWSSHFQRGGKSIHPLSGKAMSSNAETPDPSSKSNADETTTESKAPKLVVFGGNGFVGSRVCEAGVNKGLKVVSVSRSGRPSWLESGWGDSVEWVMGDCLEPSSYTDVLKGALGVVSTVGGFGSNDAMYKICGETNIRVAETAAALGIERFAFISVHEYNLPGTSGVGYFKGKRDAEETIQKYFGDSGVFLRPSLIHGTRYVNNFGVPLGAVFGPLEKVLNFLPNKQLAGIPFLGAALVPPVSVEAVGKAAVAAATEESVPGGAMDVWQIAEYS